MCFNFDSCTILYVILLAMSIERLRLQELFYQKEEKLFLFAKLRNILQREYFVDSIKGKETSVPCASFEE